MPKTVEIQGTVLSRITQEVKSRNFRSEMMYCVFQILSPLVALQFYRPTASYFLPLYRSIEMSFFLLSLNYYVFNSAMVIFNNSLLFVVVQLSYSSATVLAKSVLFSLSYPIALLPLFKIPDFWSMSLNHPLAPLPLINMPAFLFALSNWTLTQLPLSKTPVCCANRPNSLLSSNYPSIFRYLLKHIIRHISDIHSI